ncbi:hypothetical protein U717_11525 [Rhodobacter capsulatus R121]|nr:hypothetical protein U714_11370 [Rhodobacter capsulatus DE442]ETD76936.1 hypothetical protein U717_11525 [Rhodobacter capsulatus R121]ETE53772.1 hypothetical protein U715_11530 [Rhodobacter capsulatus Y262]
MLAVMCSTIALILNETRQVQSAVILAVMCSLGFLVDCPRS